MIHLMRRTSIGQDEDSKKKTEKRISVTYLEVGYGREALRAAHFLIAEVVKITTIIIISR